MKTKSNEIYFLIWKYVRKRKYVPLMHTLSIIYNIKDARWIQNNNLLILYVVQHNLGDAFLIIWLFRDVMCGTIHCMQGRDKPVIEGVVSHINSQVKNFNFFQAHKFWEDRGIRIVNIHLAYFFSAILKRIALGQRLFVSSSFLISVTWSDRSTYRQH